MISRRASGEACKYTIHYTLRGCDTDPSGRRRAGHHYNAAVVVAVFHSP